jgi:hypothetical protein
VSTVEVAAARPDNAAAVDLRAHPRDDVLRHVEQALDLRLDPASAVRKRRSIGAATDRGTWVRIEMRRVEKMAGQDFNGPAAAALLTGIAKPAWHTGLAWAEPETGVLWRADETDLVTAAPIKPGGILTTDPQLSASWWSTLDASLDALAAATTTRIATPHTSPITQARVEDTIRTVFGEDLDTTIQRWVPAHADFAWANLTGPDCWFGLGRLGPGAVWFGRGDALGGVAGRARPGRAGAPAPPPRPGQPRRSADDAVHRRRNRLSPGRLLRPAARPRGGGDTPAAHRAAVLTACSRNNARYRATADAAYTEIVRRIRESEDAEPFDDIGDIWPSTRHPLRFWAEKHQAERRRRDPAAYWDSLTAGLIRSSV